MELNTKKKYQTKRIEIRCSEEDLNRLQQKANIYCAGCLSKYLRYVGLNFIPDLEDFKEKGDE